MKWLDMVIICACALLMILWSCGDNLTVTPRYWTCDSETLCTGDSTCMSVMDVSYCTTECLTQADCEVYIWPAVCSYGVCFGECWPMDESMGEDLAFCRKYGFLCPSDCAVQGLRCDAVTGVLYPRYGCVK